MPRSLIIRSDESSTSCSLKKLSGAEEVRFFNSTVTYIDLAENTKTKTERKAGITVKENSRCIKRVHRILVVDLFFWLISERWCPKYDTTHTLTPPSLASLKKKAPKTVAAIKYAMYSVFTIFYVYVQDIVGEHVVDYGEPLRQQFNVALAVPPYSIRWVQRGNHAPYDKFQAK